MDRLDSLHDHRGALNRIDHAHPMKVNAGFGASGLNAVRWEQQDRVRVEIVLVFVAALPFDTGKASAFDTTHGVVESSLIPGGGTDPGISTHLFFHAAAESPLVQVLQ